MQQNFIGCRLSTSTFDSGTRINIRSLVCYWSCELCCPILTISQAISYTTTIDKHSASSKLIHLKLRLLSYNYESQIPTLKGGWMLRGSF
jgi:hypothetical protein